MRKQIGKKRKLFDHYHTSEEWCDLLNKDLSECESTSTKEWYFFIEAQRRASLKKYPPKPGKSAEKLEAVAIAKFLSVCDHLRDFNAPSFRDLRPDSMLHDVSQRGISKHNLPWVLARARSVCAYILSQFSIEEMFDYCKHGPGTSLGVPFGDTGNSRKWLPPWSATEKAVPWFIHYLRYDPLLLESLWHEASSKVNPDDVWKYVEIVQASKLTTVPKNNETNRCIAIEPTLNMFLQQGLGSLIAARLKNYGIDIQHQQDKHRRLAFESSISRSFATIDWSSASDCVSVELLRFLLPPAWFNAVDTVRCDNVTVAGLNVVLPCIATMGNATTFVLETLVFLCLAMATINPNPGRSLLTDCENFKNISIFGDDCIVPTESAQRFIDACVGVGFMINSDKSFIHTADPFRESCGADFFGGYDVRPIYLKGPRSEKPSVLRAWLYVMWNITSKRLKSSLGDLPYAYSRVLAWLATQISIYNKVVFLVEDGAPDDAGLKASGDWCRLCRLFSIPAVPGTIDGNGSLHYKRFVPVPPKIGLCSDYSELWLRLKFPSIVDFLDPPREIRDFTSSNHHPRGYVVSTSISFSGTLLDDLLFVALKTQR